MFNRNLSDAEAPQSPNGGNASPPKQTESRPASDIRMTRIESDETDIRVTSPSYSYSEQDGASLFPAPPTDTSAGDLGTAKTKRLRPRARPAMAVLIVLDDNQTSGEFVRIRIPKFVIGRDAGDVVFNEEVEMSGTHAEIERRKEGDRYRWYLRDRQSTNGTYVRTDAVSLKEGDEVMLGRKLFRFEDIEPPRAARLVELTPAGRGAQIELNEEELWIGRDPAVCADTFHQDIFLEQRHARLYLQDGRWRLKAEKSLNGVWTRVAEVRLVHGCWFQLGEQRFRILFP